MGWKPDAPDYRDRTLTDFLEKSARGKKPALEKFSFIPRREFFPIQDQGPLESCTAHAVVALLEYLQSRRSGQFNALSRMFLYNTTREYMGLSGDSGATIRDTIKTAALFGVPPEDKFPYTPGNIAVEPAAFLYAFASNFKALNYVRLDDVDSPKPHEIIDNIKRAITCALPVAFGFTVYSNLTTAADIPMPTALDTPMGGHALLITGYDDTHPIVDKQTYPDPDPDLEAKGEGKVTKGKPQGAFRVRNSWGTAWGEDGYGWLPYAYVQKQLACDFWTCAGIADPNPQKGK